MDTTAHEFVKGLNNLPPKRIIYWLLRISYELDHLGLLSDADRQRTTQLLTESPISKERIRSA